MPETPSVQPSRAPKLIGGALLVALAVIAVAVGALREVRRSSEAAALAASPTPAHQPDVVRVYYFHTDTRCDTCLKIEQQTADLVRAAFASDISNGRVQYQAVNFDAPEHRHFRDEFDLSFGSVVVVRGNTWENLSDVWTLVHQDQAAFDRYLTERITSYMNASP
jgi:hypothetical protein